jgi:phosphate starvation-inducible PhoH-like protein
MQPLEYIRGHSIKDVVVLDEGQLLSPDELFTMMTRIEEGGKLIIIGDPAQRDNRGNGPDAITWLKGFVERHRLYEHFAVLEATSDDIVRSGLCKDLVKAKEFDVKHGKNDW